MTSPRNAGPATTVDAVVAAIVDGIRTGRFAPGQRLVESDLTEEFGVSRGSLREAFGRLAADGVLVIEPYRGALVRKMSREQVSDLFQVREALEGHAARLAAEQIEKGDNRKRLEQVLDAVQQHRDLTDVPDYMDVNAQFHEVIVEISGNELLARMVGQLQVQAFRLLHRLLADTAGKDRSIHEHQTVASAILAGDADAAERAMREHVRSSRRHVLRDEAWPSSRPLGRHNR